MRFNLLFFLIGLIMISCSRDESAVNIPCYEGCITFIGSMNTGQNSTTPVTNTPIELAWKRKGYNGDPGRLIATTTTDEEGRFVFSFSPDSAELEGGYYYIDFFNGEFYPTTNIYPSYEVNTLDSTYVWDFHIFRPAKLTIKIDDYNPSMQGDYIYVSPRFENYNSEWPEISFSDETNTIKSLFINRSDTSFTELVMKGNTVGDQYVYLEVSSIKDGVRQPKYYDTLYVEAGSTDAMFEVDY